jgi:hypothetical protein
MITRDKDRMYYLHQHHHRVQSCQYEHKSVTLWKTLVSINDRTNIMRMISFNRIEINDLSMVRLTPSSSSLWRQKNVMIHIMINLHEMNKNILLNENNVRSWSFIVHICFVSSHLKSYHVVMIFVVWYLTLKRRRSYYCMNQNNSHFQPAIHAMMMMEDNEYWLLMSVT